MAKRKIIGLSWHWTGCLRAILGLAIVLTWGGLHVFAEAAASSAKAQVQTLTLEYQETSGPVINWPSTLHPQASALAKEPPLANGKTIRGTLNIGGLYPGTENARNSFAFVWQRDAGKLYLESLPGQAFASNSPSLVLALATPPARYQTFTNLHLTLQWAPGHSQIVADLSLYDYGDVPGAVLSLHSLWQSKWTVGGKDWQIGLIPTAPPISFTNGYLVLRPWEQRQQSFSVYDGCLSAFAIPQELFFGGINYSLNWQPSTTDAELKPVLQLSEVPVEQGVLKIGGQHVGRLLLESGKRKVLIEQPDPQVQVPAGTYARAQALLANNGAQAILAQVGTLRAAEFTVSRNPGATVIVGGPLTNSVAITRVGQDLRLVYRLLGADGREYQLANRTRPPKFTVYKDGRALATGDFEFG